MQYEEKLHTTSPQGTNDFPLKKKLKQNEKVIYRAHTQQQEQQQQRRNRGD